MEHEHGHIESLIAFTANPGRDSYKLLWKFLPNLLIIFQYSFQIQWRIGKLTFNLWKNLRADFIYLHFNLHQWLVYKTSVISTSHVTIQGTCWKWKYLSWFHCEEIMNIDFDEDNPYGKKCTAANNFHKQLANTLRLFCNVHFSHAN